MNGFKGYHPTVNFLYFCFAIVSGCIFLHPVAVVINIASGFLYFSILKGKEQAFKNLLYIIPVFLLMAIVNPLFNHRGATILAYFSNGNPLTLESVYYGFVSAGMIVCVIMFFRCFNEVISSDKIMYLLGRITPSLSLVFSMVMAFIPMFTKQFKKVALSRRCIGKDTSGGGVIQRMKNALSVLSIMITWSLENAIDTSDSMKSRGYGLKSRTTYSVYTFCKRDAIMLIAIVIMSVYVFAGGALGQMYFACFPYIYFAPFSVYGLSVFLVYTALVFLPLLIELLEVIKCTHSKI